MAISVTKKFEFESCHFLNLYNGPCARMHGHTYKLEVTVAGNPVNNGMIIDFVDLKKMVNHYIIDKMDHQNLNELKDDIGLPLFTQPTAELMVLWMATTLAPVFAQLGCTLTHVRLYETSNSHADWHNEGF